MNHYLVIGGSTGIGRAICSELAKSDKVSATYNKHGMPDEGTLNYFHYDVLDNKVPTFIPESLDGLVYCPGSIQLKPFTRFTEQDFVKDYELQVVGAVKVIQAALPALKKSGHSSIVLFSTVAVDTGFPFHSLVSSSKGAIQGLAKALAAEFAPKIRINVIAPSVTNTPLAANLLSSEDKIAANAQRHAMKRVGEAVDFAHMTKFLLSEKSSWITGQIFHVDGGISSLKV